LRDWVAKDDLVHLILAVVEQCDLRLARSNERGSGSEQYPPGMMLALLIYAYSRGVLSSRRIEQLSYESLSVRYLCANTHPDHDTSAKFRLENGSLIQGVLFSGVIVGWGIEIGSGGQARGGWDAFGSQCQSASLQQPGEQLEQEKRPIKALIGQLIEQAERADQAEEQEEKTEGLPAQLAEGQKRREAIKEALEHLKQLGAQQQADKEQLAKVSRQSQAKEIRHRLT
jgi:hypothetical protein